jgi:RNA polymerase sigma-70 factor (ECF subfamily)
VPLDVAPEVADPAPAPDESLENATLSRQIGDALQALPDRQRAAIQLCHYQDCGNIEAAEILGISVEALESLLSEERGSRGCGRGCLKDE